MTESIAVVKKEDSKRQDKAMEMAKCIIEKGRKELLETYPNPLYEGETSDNANKSTYPKKGMRHYEKEWVFKKISGTVSRSRDDHG